MVARNLEKGLVLAFSPSGELASSPGLPGLDSVFLPKAKGKADFRLSAFVSFFSPLTAGATSVVSVGTLAGLETSVARGVVVSTLGMTGAS